MKKTQYIVSACLLGERCRYDGKDKEHPEVVRFLQNKKYVSVCPELLAGWGSPRPAVQFSGGGASEVVEGKAIIRDNLGRDRTESLTKGINEALRLVRSSDPGEAILKEKSPSCGVMQVYRDGKLTRGEGLFTHRLREKGVRVRSEESFAKEKFPSS